MSWPFGVKYDNRAFYRLANESRTKNTWIILRNASAPWFKIIGLGESSWSTNDWELPRQLYERENRDIGQAYTKIPNKIMGK